MTGEAVHEETPQVEIKPAARPILEFDWQSDLTQIETDREKLKAAQTRAQEEPVVPPRKRERRSPPPISDEPLIQVETIKPATLSDPASAVSREDSIAKAVTG